MGICGLGGCSSTLLMEGVERRTVGVPKVSEVSSIKFVNGELCGKTDARGGGANGGLMLEVQRLGLNRNGVGMWLRIYNIAMFINVHVESSYVFLHLFHHCMSFHTDKTEIDYFD